VGGISASIVIFIVISAAGPSAAVVTMPAPAFGPPWWFSLNLTQETVTVAGWAATLIGGAGTAAGLAAIAKGARPSPKLLLGLSLAAVAVLTVLPPAGSSDALDYAAYGRTMVVGRNPYVMTPQKLAKAGDPIGKVAPAAWATRHSPYGPLATAEQAAAAELGGDSAASVTFWLKLWNALAFCGIAIGLYRLLRTDPARRARACLLWSLNPLLLWNLVGGGHVDTLAAAFGFFGLVLVAVRPRNTEPSTLACLAGGALVGAAADLKITFVLFGLALAWATRLSPRNLAAVATGALAILVPSYLWFGKPAVMVLIHRSGGLSRDNIYQLFSRPFGVSAPAHLMLIVVPLFVAVAALLLARLPDGNPSRPAIRPALALSVAWLLVWPFQLPWYDAIAFCLLALYPPSRLDWPMLARQVGGTLYLIPGITVGMHTGWPGVFTRAEHYGLVPLIRLGALIAVVALAITRAWHVQTSPPAGGQANGNQPVSERSSDAYLRGLVADSRPGVRPERASGDPGPTGTGPPGPW
jgi:hypothetical protein